MVCKVYWTDMIGQEKRDYEALKKYPKYQKNVKTEQF